MRLNLSNLHLDTRMIVPPRTNSQTKHSWVTFYNEECAHYLNSYLRRRDEVNPRLFQFAYRTVNRWFETAKKQTGIVITPKVLREWFCCEMGKLSVPDRYIDAFCGRVPRSVLARHYTDYSPTRLKEIYDKAGLQVLS